MNLNRSIPDVLGRVYARIHVEPMCCARFPLSKPGIRLRVHTVDSCCFTRLAQANSAPLMPAKHRSLRHWLVIHTAQPQLPGPHAYASQHVLWRDKANPNVVFDFRREDRILESDGSGDPQAGGPGAVGGDEFSADAAGPVEQHLSPRVRGNAPRERSAQPPGQLAHSRLYIYAKGHAQPHPPFRVPYSRDPYIRNCF